MTVLTKDDILNAKDFRIEPIDVPEWEGSSFIRTITAQQRSDFEALCMKADKEKNFSLLRETLVGMALCDEAGVRLFTKAEIAKLGAKSIEAITRVYKAAEKFNKLTKEDMEAEVGNSSASTSAGSSSD